MIVHPEVQFDTLVTCPPGEKPAQDSVLAALLRLGRASEAREILATLSLDGAGGETRIRLLEAQAVAARETGDKAEARRLLLAAGTGAEAALPLRSLHPFRGQCLG